MQHLFVASYLVAPAHIWGLHSAPLPWLPLPLPFQVLKTLDLGGNNITEKGAESLSAALKGHAALETLELGSNPLGAAGTQKLVDVVKFDLPKACDHCACLRLPPSTRALQPGCQWCMLGLGMH